MILILKWKIGSRKITKNKKYIKEIIKWQNDYLIWNKDGTLNKENFQELINDL